MFEPRFLVKKPFCMPTRAGAWVMLASRPSRTVTGELPEPEPLLLLLPELDEPDDDPHPASRSAATTAAPTPAPQKGLRISLFFYLVNR